MAARTVLCFGDSNTHGTCAMRFDGDQRRHAKAIRWPTVMQAALGDAWDVIAEGHPGRTAVFDDPVEGHHKNGRRVLQALLESHRPLDMVIIMLGTNDFKARFNAAPHDVALGIQRLAQDIARSECGAHGQPPKVMLAAPVIAQETGIFVETFKGASEKSKALPALLQGAAKRLNAGFVDLNTVAETDPIDGIHLTSSAHASIGAAMASAIQTYFKPQTERT